MTGLKILNTCAHINTYLIKLHSFYEVKYIQYFLSPSSIEIVSSHRLIFLFDLSDILDEQQDRQEKIKASICEGFENHLNLNNNSTAPTSSIPTSSIRHLKHSSYSSRNTGFSNFPQLRCRRSALK